MQRAKAMRAAFFPFDTTARERPQKSDADEDVYYSPDSLVAMRRAAGGAVEAVRQLFNIDKTTGRATSRMESRSASFAIVRPPGHHCCDRANGFCFFNNIAVASADQGVGEGGMVRREDLSAACREEWARVGWRRAR